jgi:pimeloyl-ACP methyl ester carboxylesterase
LATETPAQVAEVTDLIFATIHQPEEKDQRLDIYTPEGDGNLSVVVFLHGFQGTKEGYIEKSQAIADQGAIVFTINWPTWVIDLAAKENGTGFREIYDVISCAIRFARAKAPDYKGDPSKVILVGHSYGAANGSWIALGSDSLEGMWEEYAANYGGPPSHVECVENGHSSHVDAFVGIAGPYHRINVLREEEPELWKIVSPYALIGQSLDVPIRLIHGEQDGDVNPEVSVQFNDALLAAGYDSKLVLHDGGHRVPIELTIEEVQKLITLLEQ